MTIFKQAEAVEVICNTKSRRRWTALEKQQIVEETYNPNVTVSYVARKHDISPSQLFYWRRLMLEGSLVAAKSEDKVVPESEVKKLEKQVRELQRLLGKKTEENEVLKEAIKIGREKKLISRRPLQGLDDFE